MHFVKSGIHVVVASFLFGKRFKRQNCDSVLFVLLSFSKENSSWHLPTDVYIEFSFDWFCGFFLSEPCDVDLFNNSMAIVIVILFNRYFFRCVSPKAFINPFDDVSFALKNRCDELFSKLFQRNNFIRKPEALKWLDLPYSDWQTDDEVCACVPAHKTFLLIKFRSIRNFCYWNIKQFWCASSRHNGVSCVFVDAIKSAATKRTKSNLFVSFLGNRWRCTHDGARVDDENILSTKMCGEHTLFLVRCAWHVCCLSPRFMRLPDYWVMCTRQNARIKPTTNTEYNGSNKNQWKAKWSLNSHKQ